MSKQGGFWSYVHEDDKDEGGRITALAELLSRRLRLLTGQNFQIFLDHDSIGWGDDWESRIDEALIGTTFFIPILTPSYFRSESCRKELIRFCSTAKALGLEELILPIYYVTIPEVDSIAPSGDDLIDLVKRYQWIDWREIALENRDSETHRKQVHLLAEQLLARASTAEAKPAPIPKVNLTIENSKRSDSNEDDNPGIIEILAEGEQALPKLSNLMAEYSPILENLSAIINEGTQRITLGDNQGKGFAGRLLVSKWLAEKFEIPAEHLEKLAPEFLETLLKVDPMISTIFKLAHDTADEGEKAAIIEFVTTIRSVVDAAEYGLGAANTLANIIRDNSNWSKDLRKPMRRIERALLQLSDARAIFRQWKAQSSDLVGDHLT